MTLKVLPCSMQNATLKKITHLQVHRYLGQLELEREVTHIQIDPNLGNFLEGLLLGILGIEVHIASQSC